MTIVTCRHCKATVGTSTTDTLTIGGVTFRRVTTFACHVCKREQTWRPAELPLVKRKAVMV